MYSQFCERKIEENKDAKILEEISGEDNLALIKTTHLSIL